MRRLLVLTACVILCMLSAPNARPEQGHGPSVFLKEPVVDVGEIKEGETIEHDFKILNKGDQPLRIINVKPG